MNISLINLKTALYTIFVVACTGRSQYVLSQNSTVLDRYIEEGISNNLSILKSELEILKAGIQIRQASALKRPKLSFDANYTFAAGGRKLDFPIGDLLNPVYSTLNQITQSNNFPSVQNSQIQFLPNNFHETKFSFQYPIYQTELKHLSHIRKQEQASKLALKEAQTLSLRYDITIAYLQYLQTVEAQKVWESAQNVLLELKKFNESLVRNNVATKEIVATAEYELSKVDNEIFSLQMKQNSARAFFNLLLQTDLQRPVEADSALLHAAIPEYDLNKLMNQAMAHRKEPEAVKHLIAAVELNTKRTQANQKLPDVYLGGAVGFQGFGYHFNSDQAYALAQIGLTYPIYDGGINRSKVQEHKLEMNIAQKELQQIEQQIALEITAKFNELAAARFGFQTAQKNVIAAESIFKIIQNKYKAGQILLLEFLEAQNRVTTARMQQLLAWTDVLIKEAALKKAAGI
ncbi:MAG: TolC family protein [Saprospiraceae bacterium]|nr:TolC family protein [Saprospiraceae bacterium]